MHMLPGGKTLTRQVAVILRDLLKQQRFSDTFTAKEALSKACRTFGLRPRDEILEEAIDLVGSNTRVIVAKPTKRADPPPSVSDLKTEEARRILERFGLNVSSGRVRSEAARPAPQPTAPAHFPRLTR